MPILDYQTPPPQRRLRRTIHPVALLVTGLCLLLPLALGITGSLGYTHFHFNAQGIYLSSFCAMLLIFASRPGGQSPGKSILDRLLVTLGLLFLVFLFCLFFIWVLSLFLT